MKKILFTIFIFATIYSHAQTGFSGATQNQNLNQKNLTNVNKVVSDSIGLGVTTPAYRLDLYGDFGLRGNTNSDSTEAGAIVVRNGYSSNTTPWAKIGFNTTDAISRSAITFHTSPTYTALAEKMRIDSRGNVGLNTAYPDTNSIIDMRTTTRYMLPPRMTTTQRNNIVTVGAGALIYNSTLGSFDGYSSGWKSLAFTDNPTFTGLVSTTSLTVSAKVSVTYSVSPTDSTTTVPPTSWIKARLAAMPSLFTDGGAYIYLTSTTDLFQIGSSSSLGASLGVKGQGATSGTTSLLVENISGAGLFKIKDDGFFQIGAGAVSYDLNSPAIGYSAKSNQYGISIGYNAGKNQTAGGTRNIFMGISINGTISGSSNIGIGEDVFYNATSASSNIVIGNQSANAATFTGSSNTFLGSNVGEDITGGASNTSIGRYSGRRVTSGSNNVNIGYASGLVGTTATNRINIGSDAGGYETASKTLYIDAIDRGSLANGRTNSIIYGVMDATLTSQILTINAVIQAHQYSATEGSAITPVNGMLIYVNTTNGTFTSVGIWAYENGAWVKL